MADFHHRSGQQKQNNKSHKTTQRTKGAVRRAAGNGRAAVGGVKGVRAGGDAGGKAARLQRARRLREQARADVVESRRRGKVTSAAPLVIAIVALGERVDIRAVARDICRVGAEEPAVDAVGAFGTAASIASAENLCFIAAAHGDVIGALDAAAVADVVLLVMEGKAATEAELLADDGGDGGTTAGATTVGASLADACSAEALDVLSALKAQGAPTLLGLVLPSDTNRLHKRRIRLARRFFAAEFGDAVHFADAAAPGGDAAGIRRLVATSKRRTPTWRRSRATVLATAAAAESATELCVEGWVRGAELSARRLVHVRGVGAMRVDRIEVLDAATRSVVVATLVSDKPLEPLVLEATADDLAGEQTWPNEDEMGDEMDDGASDDVSAAGSETSRASSTTRRRKKKGMTSDYQDAWGMEDDDAAEMPALDEDEDDDDEDLDDEELVDLELESKRSAAREDKLFPDEVQVDEGELARVRFARYRALQSVRNSTWDALESLPREYARAHRLPRFESCRKRALRDAGDEGALQDGAALVSARADGELRAPVGAYVRLFLSCDAADGDAAPQAARLSAAAAAYTAARGASCVSSLLKHENRLSVVHFAVRPVGAALSDADPLKSKDALTVRCGHREWAARPVFSTANLNSDKHMFLRFAREHCVASAFGPISFAPAPAFFFDSQRKLVAVGHALDADPNRIVLKRAVVTGVPVRSHKRKATIKGMFHNPEDARFYKPAQLTTKHGLTANISDSIGTHGLFKVSLSRPMKQSDTVMLTLYKRVFPKLVDFDQDAPQTNAPLLIVN